MKLQFEFDDFSWETINFMHGWAINGTIDNDAPGNTGNCLFVAS